MHDSDRLLENVCLPLESRFVLLSSASEMPVGGYFTVDAFGPARSCSRVRRSIHGRTFRQLGRPDPIVPRQDQHRAGSYPVGTAYSCPSKPTELLARSRDHFDTLLKLLAALMTEAPCRAGIESFYRPRLFLATCGVIASSLQNPTISAMMWHLSPVNVSGACCVRSICRDCSWVALLD